MIHHNEHDTTTQGSADRNFQDDNSVLATAKRIIRLRMDLVSRVQQLPSVQVLKVPYLTNTGEYCELPGPFSIISEDGQGTEVMGDDTDDVTESESVDDGITPTSSTRSIHRPDRFVVRNEFGHVRIQPLLDFIEKFSHGHEIDSDVLQADSFRIGGHCVLPPPVFQSCLEEGVGIKHPLAGRFHPIAGSTIPETTLLFYGPNTPEELERVWGILLHSYHWVSSNGTNNLCSK
jgi:hypothetical protein